MKAEKWCSGHDKLKNQNDFISAYNDLKIIYNTITLTDEFETEIGIVSSFRKLPFIEGQFPILSGGEEECPSRSRQVAKYTFLTWSMIDQEYVR